MTSTFESEKNRKAFTYTVIICVVLLLLFILIRWKQEPVSIPVVQDLIEINLGNNEEGFGETQPLTKGNPTPETPTIAPTKTSAPASAPDDVAPEENAPEDAAPVVKPIKKSPVVNNSKPESKAAPKPKKPLITYPGDKKGPPGNNDTEDNEFKSQGKKPKSINDDGIPEGAKDAFGKNPGGGKGGPKVIKGSRKIVHYYTFTGEMEKATIYALIRVSPAGKGSFLGFDKKSTSRDQAYADAIRNYLKNISFDKATSESTVTVQFNFNIK
jgi:hypothetical protein